MLRRLIDKKNVSSEFSSSRNVTDVLERDLEPRDLMDRLTNELTKKILNSFSDKTRISN